MTAEDAEGPGVALISGGSRGLGRHLVESLLAAGWRVAAFARSATDATAQLGEAYPARFLWQTADLADPGTPRRVVRGVTDRFGRLDLLVNNAALLSAVLFMTASAAEITTMIASNLTAPILLAQASSRAMSVRGSGQIINISSVNSVRGYRGVAVYTATKAGLDGFSRSLARELGPFGIRVNSVVPGFFESDMTSGVNADNREKIIRRTPLGRLASVADVAAAVLFLASPEASFITGQSIIVDGGITC